MVKTRSTVKRVLKSGSIGALENLARLAVVCAVSACVISSQLLAASAYSQEVKEFLQEGSRLLKENRVEEAKAEFEKAIKADAQCPEAFNNLGLAFYRSGDLQMAAENFRKALNIDPMFAPSLTNLGLIMYTKGNYEDSIYYYKLALKLSDYKDYELHYNLANVFRDKKEYQNARDHYNAAIRLNPEFYAAYNGLGATDFCQGRLEEAVHEVEESIRLKKDYALGYYHLGLIETARKNIPRAIWAYEQSLKFERNSRYASDTKQKLEALRNGATVTASASTNPSQSQISNDMPPPSSSTKTVSASEMEKINAICRKGNWAAGRKELQELVDKGVNDPVVYNNLGMSYAQQKDYKRAVEYYQRAIRLKPGGFATANYNLARALGKLNDKQGSEAALKQAVDDSRKNKTPCPAAFNMMGLILKKKGDLKGADAAYNLAIMQAGTSLPVAHYNRAVLMEQMDNSRGAVTEYKAYLYYAPRGANAASAQERLKRLGID